MFTIDNLPENAPVCTIFHRYVALFYQFFTIHEIIYLILPLFHQFMVIAYHTFGLILFPVWINAYLHHPFHNPVQGE